MTRYVELMRGADPFTAGLVVVAWLICGWSAVRWILGDLVYENSQASDKANSERGPASH